MIVDLETALLFAGWIHLAVAAASLAVPRLLDWRLRLAPLDRFTRQLFWVYAAFVLLTNVGFGLLLLLESSAVAGGSGLGRAVAGFIGLYWVARLAVQLLVFDLSNLRTGRLARFGYHSLTLAFLYLVAVCGWAALGP